jgi:hypothetical protein
LKRPFGKFSLKIALGYVNLSRCMSFFHLNITHFLSFFLFFSFSEDFQFVKFPFQEFFIQFQRELIHLFLKSLLVQISFLPQNQSIPNRDLVNLPLETQIKAPIQSPTRALYLLFSIRH